VSFIDRFISFTCDVSLTDRDVHERARRKLPRHEREDARQFYAKVVAAWYLHRPLLMIAAEPIDEGTPRLSITAPEGHYELWADVGEASARRLRAATRLRPTPEIFQFFYDDDHLAPLLTALRGSTENWVDKIHFIKLDPDLLDHLIEHEATVPGTTSQHWSFTMPDDQTLYLAVDGAFFASSITEISIWDAFQKSLNGIDLN
jgi:hypothetical protein